MLHEMNLNAPSFEKIADGSKVVELRLYDEQRKKIKLGDVIEFHKNDSNETIQKGVSGLLNFADFGTLIDCLPLEFFGCDSREEVKTGVNKIYSNEQQKKFGVLGIMLS